MTVYRADRVSHCCGQEYGFSILPGIITLPNVQGANVASHIIYPIHPPGILAHLDIPIHQGTLEPHTLYQGDSALCVRLNIWIKNSEL